MRSLLLVLVLAVAGPAAAAGAERIVTLSPHLAELVHAAGAGDRLVATVAFSDHPIEVVDLPQVGDAFRIDLERLAAVDPDLVLAWSGGTPLTAIEEIERLGYRVVALHTETLGDIARQLREIGTLAGSPDRAEAAADAFETRLVALRARYRDASPVRVFYQIAERPLYTIGGTHSLSDAIALCGGVNVFAGVKGMAPLVSDEAVLAAGPQVMLTGVHPPGDGPGPLSKWARWSDLPAVRDGHLYQLDATVMGRPTPRLLDGVERMCGLIAKAR